MQNIPIGVSIIKFKIKDNISFMKEMNCKLVMKMQKIVEEWRREIGYPWSILLTPYTTWSFTCDIGCVKVQPENKLEWCILLIRLKGLS